MEAPKYLEIAAGPYDIAVPTPAVTAVLQDVHPGRLRWTGRVAVGEVALAGGSVPLIDLGALRADTDEPRFLPFVIGYERDGVTVALRADRIDYLGSALSRCAVPPFGLSWPGLYEGAVRFGGRVALVIDPRPLADEAPPAGPPENLTPPRGRQYIDREATGDGLAGVLKPVMTFRVAGDWIGVQVDQMESVALATRLWPVPLTTREYIGLHDDGEHLVPVLALDDAGPRGRREQLLAILHVRGEPVGLSVAAAGRVHEHYWIDDAALGRSLPPGPLSALGAQLAHTGEQSFWIIDPDRLWPDQLWPAPAAPAW